MNYRLLSKLLGIVAMLIGGTMLFSLPWAHPAMGRRAWDVEVEQAFEVRGFVALIVSMIICFGVGGLLYWLGRGDHGRLYRKEAMAIVGLSWVMATLLGALPYAFAGVQRGSAVRLMGDGQPALIHHWAGLRALTHYQWVRVPPVNSETYIVLDAMAKAGAVGISEEELATQSDNPDAAVLLNKLTSENALWDKAIIYPDDRRRPSEPTDRARNYRFRWVHMGLADVLFESQSGFSTTGATVLSDLEDPHLIPHCILFWRSSTHFLGGLGIVVLFVAILGQGSAGKTLMRAEMPGPTKEGATARMQHTAWLFAGIYCILNAVLTIILWWLGLTFFDALCHAFGTMATGGFSTWNASLGHFQNDPGVNDAAVEYIVMLFMILAGSNFTLLYYVMFRGQILRLFRDVEWRTYLSIILVATLLIILFGLAHGDWLDGDLNKPILSQMIDGLRYALFQVVAITTTTGFGTHDFDRWSSFARGALFVLMFVGGCAGSTGGGMKVIRHVLFAKIMRLEIERSYRPTVVRPLRLGGVALEAPELQHNILVYFGLITGIFVASWLFVLTVEPDTTWGATPEHKLIDSASGVTATLNNIGPGLGIVGATQNYGNFSPLTKLLFTVLMMIGRVEVFVILVLFVPRFWQSR